MRKVHSLTGRITSDMMCKAFLNVKRNRGCAGVDKVSIGMFEANLEDNLTALMRAIKRGTFRPCPLRRVYIPKSPTQQRPLGIPTVRDRVAQDVLRQLLDPIFTPQFHDWSFGFIKGRNCHQAVEQVLEFKNSGFKWVVDADIKAFFDEIPHDLIVRLVSRTIADGNVLKLLEHFLKSGVMEQGKLQPTVKGTPQGGLISPLMANIVMNELDQQLSQAGHKFVRYADDFVVVCPDQIAAEQALALVKEVIEGEMELTLHPTKTKLRPFRQGFEFLGFRISSYGVSMRPKAMEKFQEKIRNHTIRSHNLDADAIERLNRVIRGTVNYFGASFATVTVQFDKLDRYIRTRFRCMKYKRIWKTDRRRLRNKYISRAGILSCREIHATACIR